MKQAHRRKRGRVQPGYAEEFVAPKEEIGAQSRIRAANPETCSVQGGPGDTTGQDYRE